MFDIEKADAKALKKYAMDELGLVLSLTMKPGTMRQKIYDACKEKGITPPIEDRREPDTRGIDKSKYVTINIQRTSGKGGGAPVFVGWNGKGFAIPRGKDIPVPPAVEEILHNAVQTLFELPDLDDPGGEMIERDVLAHPYQIVAGHENIRRFQQPRVEAEVD